MLSTFLIFDYMQFSCFCAAQYRVFSILAASLIGFQNIPEAFCNNYVYVQRENYLHTVQIPKPGHTNTDTRES